MVEVLVVAFAGGLGAVARGLLDDFRGRLPWGILIANTVATAIAAWAMLNQPPLTLALAVGLAGGLSTFSTFVSQTWRLLSTGKRLLAFWNIVLNLLLPSTAVLLVVVCR